MRTLDYYLDAARARAQLRSDHELAGALEVNRTAITQYRTHRIWPGDDTMRRLAELAGADVHAALVELNIWRAKSAAVQDQYRSILTKISATLATIIVAGMTVAHAEQAQYKSASALPPLYIMRLGHWRLVRYLDTALRTILSGSARIGSRFGALATAAQ